LAEKVSAGYLTTASAQRLATRILRENALRFFKLG